MIFAISQILPFIAYWYVVNYTTIEQSYIDNLNKKCPPFTLEKIFHERAFPYIGNPSLAYGCYLGILFQHRFLTSNCTNQTELWKYAARLLVAGFVAYIFVWQLKLVSWLQNIYILYINKTIVPCGICAFIFAGFLDSLMEVLGLLERSYVKGYCVFVYPKGSGTFNHDDPITEALLPSKRPTDKVTIN